MITDEIRKKIGELVDIACRDEVMLDEIQEEFSKMYRVKCGLEEHFEVGIEEKITDFVRKEIRYNSERACKYAIDILTEFYLLRKNSNLFVNKASLVQLSAEKTGLTELTVSQKIRYLVYRIVDYINKNDESMERVLNVEYSRSVEILEIFYQRYMSGW